MDFNTSCLACCSVKTTLGLGFLRIRCFLLRRTIARGLLAARGDLPCLNLAVRRGVLDPSPSLVSDPESDSESESKSPSKTSFQSIVLCREAISSGVRTLYFTIMLRRKNNYNILKKYSILHFQTFYSLPIHPNVQLNLSLSPRRGIAQQRNAQQRNAQRENKQAPSIQTYAQRNGHCNHRMPSRV